MGVVVLLFESKVIMKSEASNELDQKHPMKHGRVVDKARETAVEREAREARQTPASGAFWLFISGVSFCLLLFFCAHCALKISEVGWASFALTNAARRGIEAVATETFPGLECLQKGLNALRAERAYKQEHPEREGETITEIIEWEEGLAECRGAAAREKSHDWAWALLVAWLFWAASRGRERK